MIQYTPLHIPDVWVITPQIFGDQRGSFAETFRTEEFHATVCPTPFIQENESVSQRGVLRGLHLQVENAQAKLVRCVYGCVIDVAVDLRPHSSYFGQYVLRKLDDVNKEQLYIPRGFAHGFLVLSEWAVFSYKVDNKYAPSDECSLSPFDPDLSIDWELFGLSRGEIIQSTKDAQGITLTEYKQRYL